MKIFSEFRVEEQLIHPAAVLSSYYSPSRGSPAYDRVTHDWFYLIKCRRSCCRGGLPMCMADRLMCSSWTWGRCFRGPAPLARIAKTDYPPLTPVLTSRKRPWTKLTYIPAEASDLEKKITKTYCAQMMKAVMQAAVTSSIHWIWRSSMAHISSLDMLW